MADSRSASGRDVKKGSVCTSVPAGAGQRGWSWNTGARTCSIIEGAHRAGGRGGEVGAGRWGRGADVRAARQHDVLVHLHVTAILDEV